MIVDDLLQFMVSRQSTRPAVQKGSKMKLSAKCSPFTAKIHYQFEL